MTNPLLSIEIEGRRPDYRGKVREIFDLGDRLLMVATDRLSAFDCILPTGIPGKGAVLRLSRFWFRALRACCPRTPVERGGGLSRPVPPTRGTTAGRSMLVKGTSLDIEAVVRGYGRLRWKDYGGQRGLRRAGGLRKPTTSRFTPAARSDTGRRKHPAGGYRDGGESAERSAARVSRSAGTWPLVPNRATS
jgi:phosphoribosylaminoimidazole-succinocarboxamide synthase